MQDAPLSNIRDMEEAIGVCETGKTHYSIRADSTHSSLEVLCSGVISEKIEAVLALQLLHTL